MISVLIAAVISLGGTTVIFAGDTVPPWLFIWSVTIIFLAMFALMFTLTGGA